MTIQDAIAKMREGKKVRHRYFIPGEWMKLENGLLLLEDGVRISLNEFFNTRNYPCWDSDWEVVD